MGVGSLASLGRGRLGGTLAQTGRAMSVVKGYDGGQIKASDWSKHYANHLVTSLN